MVADAIALSDPMQLRWARLNEREGKRERTTQCLGWVSSCATR